MKDIEGFEGYYKITSDGRIWSCIKNQYLKPGLSGCGYLTVRLCKDGVGKSYSLHRLIARAFISKPIGKEYINHIDSDRQNNRLNNLEWCTQKENMQHAIKSGRRIRSSHISRVSGIEHFNAKLDDDKVRAIRHLYALGGISHGKLARHFDVSRPTIHQILHKRTWKHIA